jgi:hypothetical protein
MSLNSIKFGTTDIALLFKNTLVDIDEKKQDSPKQNIKSAVINSDPIANEWRYLGENKKKTLIVVRYADIVHLPDKQLSFLTKLLAACNLNLGDVAIFNFFNHQSSQFNELFTYFKPKVVLLFDIKPTEFGMPMNFPDFQVQAYKDAVFVSSPSLETIEPDKNLKGKLWVSLKKIYNL